MSCPNPNCRHGSKRKLRPLVISIVSPPNENSDSDSPPRRHERIQHMFASHPSLAWHFEPPTFSPGVPARELRNRWKFLQHCQDAGLIPAVEWDAIGRAVHEQTVHEQALPDNVDPFRYLSRITRVPHDDSDAEGSMGPNKWKLSTITEALVPLSPHRLGSTHDISQPFSMELWRKAKTLNRDRTVLACTLAHLIAMKAFVTSHGSHEGFDLILEDNVRAFVGSNRTEEYSHYSTTRDEFPTNSWTGWSCECASRIWDTIEASEAFEMETDTDKSADNGQTRAPSLLQCHMRYYGWLGSLPNVSWVYQKHIPRKGRGTEFMKIFPFPTNHDFELDSIPTKKALSEKSKKQQLAIIAPKESSSPHFATPGGTAIFGTFSYSISPQAYHSLISQLQNDVGSLLWKGKRMRSYLAKPIDKILPRHIRSIYGEKCVHLPEKVAFVRCPMLGSLLHQKWEQSFCESTELQLHLSSTFHLEQNDVTVSMDETFYSPDATADDNWSSVWDNVWLTEMERQLVEHRKKNGTWAPKNVAEP